VSSKDWLEKDFYAELGVSKTTSTDEIKKAYRKLARELHPDRNPGNTQAEERFKAVSEAYGVLSDDKQRREYDEMRSLFGSGQFRRNAGAGARPGTPPGFNPNDLFGGVQTEPGRGSAFSDLFSSIFTGNANQAQQQQQRRGPARGRDVETEVSLGFTDAVRGTTLPLTLRSPGVCDTCNGNGARPGTNLRKCNVCHGTGIVDRNQGSFSFAEPCRDCQGVGTVVEDKCPECRGTGGVTKTRSLTVRFPPGVADGQRIRLAGRGEPGARGGPAGNLYVTVRVKTDALFGRNGDDLTLTVPVTFAEAVLGTDLKVPTLDGSVTLRVPPGTPSGRTLRARGKGVAKRDGQAGDLLVTLEVVVPDQLSDEARKALQTFAANTPGAGREQLEARLSRHA